MPAMSPDGRAGGKEEYYLPDFKSPASAISPPPHVSSAYHIEGPGCK